MGKKITTEEFIEKANFVHGDVYNYSLTNYVNALTKVKLICHEHGVFEQLPSNHLSGKGCSLCGISKVSKNRSKNKLNKKFEGINQPEDYKLIPISNGLFVKVDNEDFNRVKDINWTNNGSNYARNKKIGYMHRFIIDCPVDMVVDNINHNTLDNRKSNLRICTHQENLMNQSIQNNTYSKYKGVYWNKINKNWNSRICFQYKNINLGSFDSEVEAAKAYDKKAKELFGEFYLTNFDESNILNKFTK